MTTLVHRLEVLGYSAMPGRAFKLLPSAKFTLHDFASDKPHLTIEFEANGLDQLKDIMEEISELQVNSLWYFRISVYNLKTHEYAEQINLPQQVIVYRGNCVDEIESPTRLGRFVISISTACVKEPQRTHDLLTTNDRKNVVHWEITVGQL